MPLYEYRCEKCGKTFEVIQKFSDAPVEVHEGCGGHVERLLSAPALQFKGSGWYVNDYAKGSSKSSGESKSSESKADSKSDSSGESKSSKSESKTESKSESKSSESKPAPSGKD